MEAKRTAIVVDDDATIASALAMNLRSADPSLEVRPFTSAAQTLRAISADQPDLLLTDYRMPEMDGITLLKRARKVRPSLQAIVMTGFGRPDLKMEALRLGAAYVEKPFNTQALVEMALSFIGGGPSTHSAPQPSGFMGGLEVADLLQIFGLKGLSRTLVAIAGDFAGSVYVEAGNVVHAETADLEGFEALAQIIQWRRAEMQIHEKVLTHKRTLNDSVQHALLEANRLADEAQFKGKGLNKAFEGETALDDFLSGLGISEELFAASGAAQASSQAVEAAKAVEVPAAKPAVANTEEQLESVRNVFAGLQQREPGILAARLLKEDERRVVAASVAEAKSRQSDPNAGGLLGMLEVCRQAIGELRLGDLESLILTGVAGVGIVQPVADSPYVLSVKATVGTALGITMIELEKTGRELRRLLSSPGV